MRTEPDARKLKRKGSPIYFHAEATAVAAEDAASAYQAPSLIAAGAEARDVSTLNALLNLPIALLYLWLPSIMRKIGSRKRSILLLATLDTVSWLPLLAVMFLSRQATPFWLIVLWVVNLIPGVLLFPLRDSWLADVVPAGRIGRHLGVRTAVSAIAYLGTFFVTGRLLHVFNDQIFRAFAIVFLVAFIATLIRAIIYYLTPDCDHGVEREGEFGIGQFLQEVRGRGLGKFVLHTSLFKLAVSLCSPLFAVYMVHHLKFSYTTFAVVLSAEYVARVVSAPLWGRHSDRVGNLPVVRRMAYLIPFIPILWLVSSNPVYLVGVELFSGTVWAGFDISTHNLVYTTSSPEKRTRYITYGESLTALCQGIGALVGASILGFMIPVRGSQILALFVLSGVGRFLAAVAMPRAIKADDYAAGPASSQLESSPCIPIGETGYAGSPSRQGIYVQLQGSLPSSKYEDTEIGHSRMRSRVARSEVYYRSPDRRHRGNYCPEEDALRKTYMDAVKSRRGLFYRPQDWAHCARQEAPGATGVGRMDSCDEASLHETYGKAVASRRGLLYRHQDWANYAMWQKMDLNLGAL